MRIKVYPRSKKYYGLLYEVKRSRFMSFLGFDSTWEEITEVWNGATIDRHQPVMYSRYDDAVERAKFLATGNNYYDFVHQENEKYRELLVERNIYTIIGDK
jgi:hypothetical protein